jgi:hypothetical protein
VADCQMAQLESDHIKAVGCLAYLRRLVVFSNG